LTAIAFINDPGKSDLVAQHCEGGLVSLRCGRNHIVVSTTEIARLISFAHDNQPVAVSPVKARMSTFHEHL